MSPSAQAPMMSRPTPTNPVPADFGPNVLIFDPSTNIQNAQQQILDIWAQQENNQFGTARYAYFFKPGTYSLDVKLSYYTTVHGLGLSPDDAVLTGGGVQSLGVGVQLSGLNNFWRGAENLAVVAPTANTIEKWAVSQATFLRRIHVGNSGKLFLFDFPTPAPAYGAGFTSGGFIADSKIDGEIASGSQQQFITRNTTLTNWSSPGVWNMVFVGDDQPPNAPWPSAPNTVVGKTPAIREKPYLVFTDGIYKVKVPALKTNSQGTSWSGSTPDAAITLPINKFYIAKPDVDTADSINAALQTGYHLILTPGIYNLTGSLQVNLSNTVILGLGMATLSPTKGTPAMTIADVDGVSVSGILFDAGLTQSPSILTVGPSNSSADHSANPTVLHDLSCRVGGAAGKASAQNCFTINSNNVILDNVWLWRADHGKDAADIGWNVNPCDNGLTVNGQFVTAYGLFVEHFQGFQTYWNGENGSVYMYQSEIPYDVPSQGLWQQQGRSELGFPSYKVGSQVRTHTAQGLGVYCNFQVGNFQLDNAIETPQTPGIKMQHMMTVWLDGKAGSSINHVINGKGAAVVKGKNGVPTTANA